MNMNALPFLDACDGGEPAGEQNRASNFTNALPMRPLRILLVDDDASIREHLKEFLLRVEGHTVETATDGRDGLESFCEGSWDLVLVDRAMPHMNGFELARAIKERAPRTPVAMISGVPSLAIAGQEGESAIDVFLPKPFTVDELRGAIQYVSEKYPEL